MAVREIPLEILGTGHYVPTQAVASAIFDQRFAKPAGWTFEQTGVRLRSIAGSGESVLSMAAVAAQAALKNGGVSPADLDAIVSVGSVPAQAIPCTAALLQKELDLSASGIPAFDVNATCVGFPVALDLIAQGMATGRYRTVLIVASERPSVGLNPNDPVTAGLFGDGAAAVIVGAPRRDGAALLASHFQTFGEGAAWCRFEGGGSDMRAHTNLGGGRDDTYFEMLGRPMYRLAAERLPSFLDTLLQRAGLQRDDVHAWVAHQASGHALRHIKDALGLPPDRFLQTLETQGNLVSASIPATLHRGITALCIQPGDIVALVGTGAGLSLAGSVIRF